MCDCGVWNHISLYVKLFRLFITGRKGLQAPRKRRGIIVQYIEYQSVCHFVGTGSPHPFSSMCVSPLAGEGWGGGANLDDQIEILALCAGKYLF
jgi:hypothetical protein